MKIDKWEIKILSWRFDSNAVKHSLHFILLTYKNYQFWQSISSTKARFSKSIEWLFLGSERLSFALNFQFQAVLTTFIFSLIEMCFFVLFCVVWTFYTIKNLIYRVAKKAWKYCKKLKKFEYTYVIRIVPLSKKRKTAG